jgi:hypothetical protein
MIEACALHANAEEVPETNLGNVVDDELIVLEVSAWYISRSRGDRHIRL